MKYRREFSAKRVINQVGGKITKQARQALNQEAKDIETAIRRSSLVPVRSGELIDSIDVKFVGGKNPRMVVETAEHGLYQNEGTRKGIEPKRFIESVVVKKRREWEGSVRERTKL